MRLIRSLFSPAIALLAGSALVGHAAAQVTTDCFPMQKDCPPDPAFGMDYNFNFNTTPSVNAWETTVGPVEWDANQGAIFRIKKQGDSPTIRTKFYYFWGRTEIIMKAAKGRGIISSVMMLSDNLDEIDWEFLGLNETIVQSNYFGKNSSDFHNAGIHTVNGNVYDEYHNYTSVWTKDALDMYIDGAKVRTLLPKDANNTHNYPQTPMRLSIGIWAGGDPRLPQGTRDWAGGTTDYSEGPFEMFVKSAHVSDYSTGKEYQYSDHSGSWESIKIVSGNSTIKDEITAPPPKTLAQKWNDLPQGAKIAIYACAAGFGALLIFTALYYCIRQRRHGAREAKAAEARAEAERLELERFRKAGVDPDSFIDTAAEYNAKDMRRDGLTDKDSYSVPPSPTLEATTPASPLDHRWDAASASLAGAAAMRSPVPLLHQGAQSPRMVSPGMYADRPGSSHSTRSPGGGFRSPASPAPRQHAGSPAPSMRFPGGSQQQQFVQPPNRSYTAPNAQMRTGSPAPSLQHRFDNGPGSQRSASPAQLAHPQPQRSYTTGGYGGPQQGQGYGNGSGRNGSGSGRDGNQGYWGNGGGGGGGGYR